MGAEDIDEVATAARLRMLPCGRTVLGHGDWRAEHVRFEATQPVVAYDWEGLSKRPEPDLVGHTALAFCADWSRADYVQTPTIEESRAFIAAYEEARGHPFDRIERTLCGASFAYTAGYIARCVHALGRDERRKPGTCQHLIAMHGLGLLNL